MGRGFARILQGLGAKALATTSSGFALTLSRKDYGVAREKRSPTAASSQAASTSVVC
jgi:2-methylisocitrate lyase-like PEP mutase family enzyme